MFDIEKWQEIFSNLKQHKLRTSLTAFGVFWGIFMLTVLLGAGKGLENGVIENFKEIPNSAWIWPRSKTQLAFGGMPVGRFIELKSEDVEGILANVPSVGKVYSQNNIGLYGGAPAETSYKNNNGNFSIQGVHEGMEPLYQQKVIEGRYINQLDNDAKRKVAVIGERVKEQLFKTGEKAIGAEISIAGSIFQVVGVYQTTSTGEDNSADEKVLLPNETLRYTFNQVKRVGSFVVLPKAGIHAEVAEKGVIAYLQQKNKVDPNDKGVFGSFNLQSEFEKIFNLFTGIKLFSWVVAIGTIMAGAIGVGNIMLIIVKERTREIGLRKALGATPVNIVSMVVQESVFITAVAGYGGLVVGVLLIEGVNAAMSTQEGKASMFRHPEVDFQTAIIALIVLVIAGFLASLMPAARAAGVNPVVALQDE